MSQNETIEFMSVQTELDIKTQMFLNFFYKTLNVEKKKNKQTNK